MKVMIVMGTRPEVIKLAPVIAALRGHIETIICVTGQHREMLQQALDVFSIKPDVYLDTMSPGQSLNILASRLLADLDHVLGKEKPDWVIVQGDTTTALYAAIAAFHRGIKVAHVEAGLRTGDLSSPFPEEANRSMLARIASLHLAPTRSAKQALIAEGISANLITVTGNTVVDAIQMAQQSWVNGVPASLSPAIKKMIGEKPLILVTCHRRENFGDALEAICQMVKRLCARYQDFQWVFPVHLNPNVRDPVNRILANISNLSLIEPVDYQTSLYLISRCSLVVSDSGGIQEEAPSFGVPVVVMRTHTERKEGVDAGFATLAGQNSIIIEVAVSGWLDDPKKMMGIRNKANPYGDGMASQRVLSCLFGEAVEEFNG
jgi:UDP-N-acetylglucosamine 2-epimerase (non-hydrolysing)